MQAELGISISQTEWPLPIKAALSGNYVDLVSLSSDLHVDDLWTVASTSSDSFAYLRYGPFAEPEELRRIVTDLAHRPDQPSGR